LLKALGIKTDKTKGILALVIAILCFETYTTYQFYSGEPEFPTRIFQADMVNVLSRDLLLLGLAWLCRRNLSPITSAIKDYRPVAITVALWLGISVLIIKSLNLIVNAVTILAVLAGIVNNIIFVLLGAFLWAKLDNLPAKAIYFLTYMVTILIFYCDTAYFLVTSSHIESVIFDNLNGYSAAGVLYTADLFVLLAILLSFGFLVLLFNAPRRPSGISVRTVITTVLVCIGANLVNLLAINAYPQALRASGYCEEADLEKSRNMARRLLTQSVALNLLHEFGQSRQPVFAAARFERTPFTPGETALLGELGLTVEDGLLPPHQTFLYKRVVVIVSESFHRDYLHYYNPAIPAAATMFLDQLLATYPHVDNYYTANRPTTFGLNAMFLSQLMYAEEQAFDGNTTLFKVLQQNGYHTLFLEATSQYYDDEYRKYKKRFGMQTYRAKEDLEKLGYTGSTGWGFHNDVMYAETVRILEENRDNKAFIVTKLIDSHQPYPYCGIPDADIPAALKNNIYLRAIYWEDRSLEKFFRELENRNLLDNETLVIFTSDHNPHPSNDDDYTELGQGELRRNIAPIPLIFVSRNLRPFTDLNSAAFASQIDFAPTLLGILGIPAPPHFSGKNILSYPKDLSFALGNVGETLYYWSKDRQLSTDMYTDAGQDAYAKALIHWALDSYARYFEITPGASNL